MSNFYHMAQHIGSEGLIQRLKSVDYSFIKAVKELLDATQVRHETWDLDAVGLDVVIEAKQQQAWQLDPFLSLAAHHLRLKSWPLQPHNLQWCLSLEQRPPFRAMQIDAFKSGYVLIASLNDTFSDCIFLFNLCLDAYVAENSFYPRYYCSWHILQVFQCCIHSSHLAIAAISILIYFLL